MGTSGIHQTGQGPDKGGPPQLKPVMEIHDRGKLRRKIAGNGRQASDILLGRDLDRGGKGGAHPAIPVHDILDPFSGAKADPVKRIDRFGRVPARIRAAEKTAAGADRAEPFTALLLRVKLLLLP